MPRRETFAQLHAETLPAGRALLPTVAADAAAIPAFDLFHTIVFPNNIRKLRRRRGIRKLLGLTPLVPHVPYVRLSKIERGEVVARIEELVQIAAALEVDPRDLLIDVTDPAFDLPRWAADQGDMGAIDVAEEEMAVLVGAALRFRRNEDRSLTPARMESEFGLPPAIVSRLENGLKPLSRWNADVQAALCRIFDVPDVAALSALVRRQQAAGQLAPFLGDIRNPEQRQQRTAQAVRALFDALAKSGALPAGQAPLTPTETTPAPLHTRTDPTLPRRMVPVEGSALANGLVARTPTTAIVAIPRSAGPDAWAMRVCWQSLGPGLPAQSIIVIDPARFPHAGGLAVVREGPGYRLLAVKADRQGRLRGYSEYPEGEVEIDTLSPSDVAAVVAAIFE